MFYKSGRYIYIVLLLLFAFEYGKNRINAFDVDKCICVVDF